MIDEHIPVSEYRARREKVLRSLKGAVGVVFAGDGSPPLVGQWRPNTHFYYLTGLAREPGASVLFDPKNPDPTRRCVLMLKPRDPEMEDWDGLREPIGLPLRKQTGFDKVVRSTYLPRMLTMAARRSKRLACLDPVGSYMGKVPEDLSIFRKIAERMVGVSIEDKTELLNELRSVKSKHEVAVMKKAIKATAAGFDKVLQALEPGRSEAEIHAVLDGVFREHGSTGPAYNPIVGAGVNSTVLHYNANDQPIEDGDLVCIDAGAEYGRYAADVTRTFPANGKFSERQREIYEIVLRAEEAAIRAAKPGVRFHELDEAARAIIEKAGFGDQYIHGIGHHLGLEVHDASPDAPLAAGAVITIEPGIYLRDEKIGVRIEDDIQITANGSRNLTKAIIKDPDEIEAAMRKAKRAR